MTRELRSRGWSVNDIDLIPAGGSVQRDCLTHFRDTVRTYDLIVHAAASSPHRAAIDREPVHVARNLQLDAAMFDWAVRTGQGRVVYLSSSAAYPLCLQWTREKGPLTEGDVLLGTAMAPDADYGWTKVTGEILARAARKAGLPVTVVRPFSGYGEDQSEDFPFRAIVERARRREDPFTIWGDGRQVRDWIHIDDVIAGILAVVESGTDEPVNVCTGVGTSMVDLARMACEVAGHEPEFEFRLSATRPASTSTTSRRSACGKASSGHWGRSDRDELRHPRGPEDPATPDDDRRRYRVDAEARRGVAAHRQGLQPVVHPRRVRHGAGVHDHIGEDPGRRRLRDHGDPRRRHRHVDVQHGGLDGLPGQAGQRDREGPRGVGAGGPRRHLLLARRRRG
jgi:nucleoside-diphosphate-sugar epimerase